MSNKCLDKLFGTRESETEKIIAEVTNALRDKDKQIESLKQENCRLKSEHYKDEEIQRLMDKTKNLTDDLCRGFSITKEQKEKIDAFQLNHEKEVHNGRYGNYTYEFYPTEIGTFGRVRCKCGAKFDFQKAW